MNELLKFDTEDLSVGDFLLIHKDCEIKTVGLGTIVGGMHAMTFNEGNEVRKFMLSCVTHNITSESFMQELPIS